MAKEVQLALKPGGKAPAFSATATDGTTISLAGLKGRDVILYFYPRDDTPGGTKEACAFRDGYSRFKAKGAVGLGLSADMVKSHAKVTEQFSLPFPLVADNNKAISMANGACGEKTFMGRKYLGVHRVTFHIGPDGKIAHVWPRVNPEEHAAEVLAALG